MFFFFFFFSSRRRHTRWNCDWSSDVCSSDLCADRWPGGPAVRKNASPTATFQITRMGCPSAWGSAKADVPPPPYQSPPIPRVRRGFGRDGLITGCADRGGEQQGGDAGRGREREPGHLTELQAERHPSTRLDS